MLTIAAEPYPFTCDPSTTALIVIDMQRDFLEPGGFGQALGNDVSLLRQAIAPTRRILAAAREADLLVVHTREGHRPDLTDCPASKRARGQNRVRIGDAGPMGRILVRGEYGHDIIDELRPIDGEVVVDKPGKGAFYATDLEAILHSRGIRSLILTGVTAEVCVQTTIREANDRGYECVLLSDCTGSYFPEFHLATLAMVKSQGGIFGWVTDSAAAIEALAPATSIELFVNGTLMRGLALNPNLDGAEFVGEFHTLPMYALYSIDDVHPGMFYVETGGVAVAGELYRMPCDVLERVESREPPHLYRGPTAWLGL